MLLDADGPSYLDIFVPRTQGMLVSGITHDLDGWVCWWLPFLRPGAHGTKVL
jgi:hypothetical protein